MSCPVFRITRFSLNMHVCDAMSFIFTHTTPKMVPGTSLPTAENEQGDLPIWLGNEEGYTHHGLGIYEWI